MNPTPDRPTGFPHEHAELFRLIVESAREYAIFTVDMAGRVVTWNTGSERILGYKDGEIIGRDIDVLFTPEDVARGQAAREMRTALESGRASDQRWHLRKGGVRFWADGLMMPLEDATGAACGFVKIFRDSTAEKLASEERERLMLSLREADRRKDEFLAMLAHELRNPLATIGNAVSLSAQSGRQEHIDWSLGVIGQQVRHLTRLIDDLLDVSRFALGKIELRKLRVDALPIVTGAVEVVRPLIQARRHELTLSFSARPLWTDADPTRMEQMLVNLIGNAAKYTGDGGRIRVVAEHAGDWIVIRVRDNGVGIAPEKLSEMFELFMQEDRSLGRSEGGLGIGLTLVKSLAEMHGGTITAASEGRGKGSEFTLRLPAAAGPGPPAEAAPPRPAADPPRPTRILIVDDSKDTARALSRLLAHLGHEVEVAHDGPSAIAAAAGFRPRVVLLDIGLPGMDGYEVAARLREQESCRGAVIVAISGYGRESDVARSREAGFDHHLVKPVNPDDLIDLIASAAPADGG